VIFLVSLTRLIPIVLEGGGFYGAAGQEYIDNIYSTMVREVTDGYPLVGNPFYIEHQGSIAPAFIAPFWVAALPMMAGLPFAATLELNFTLWSLIFGIVLYIFFRQLDVSGRWSAIGTIGTYLLLFGQIVNFTALLVYPVFLLFILAFFLWFDRPNTIRDAFLGFAAAFAIYEYTFLLQVVAVFLVLAFVFLLCTRDWVRVRHALIVGAYTSVLCIPFLIMTLMQLNDPSYMESMVRTGLGYTHIPSGEVIRIGTCVVLFAISIYLSWKWIFRTREFPHALFVIQYMLLGMATLIVSAGNIVTGLDMETASHAARFTTIWLIVGSIAAAYFLFVARTAIAQLSMKRKMAFGCVLLLTLLSGASYLHVDPYFGLADINSSRMAALEALAVMPAMQWLDANEQEQKVIWTNPDTGNHLYIFIPNYTKHYLLYTYSATVELLLTSEQEERYLVANALSKVTLESIAADLPAYDGGGALLDTPSIANRGVKICRALHLSLLGYQCGSLTDARTLFASHFADMYKKFTTDIRPHLRDELKKFHVSYIMKDLRTDADFHPERLPYVKEVYSDGRFKIYKII